MNQDIKAAYNTAAEIYRAKYDAIPARTAEIDQVLGMLTTLHPFVVEIGCAYGREASYLVTKTNRYVGIDISEAYIQMATAEVPAGEFHCVDVMEYDFPANIDAVFAFASLLHLPKEALAEVLARIEGSLRPGGVVFLLLKRCDQYSTAIETDDVVSRRFYYYTQDTLRELLPAGLVEVCYDEQERKEPWLTMILQKHI